MIEVPSFKHAFPGLAFFILALLIGMILLYYPGKAEFFFLDLQFLLSQLFSATGTISDHLVIIVIDELSLKNLQVEPGSRLRVYHMQMIKKLKEAGALVIAFDIAFNTKDEKTDKEFAHIIKDSGNVISGEIEEFKTVKLLKESFSAIGSLYTEDYWKVPRRIFVHPNNTKQKAFSLEIAEMHYNKHKTGKKENETKWPFGESFWINYAYRPDYFPLFSSIDILKSNSERIADKNHTPLSILKDKIVLIGYGQEQCYLPNPEGKRLPSLYTHAYAVENLLNGRYMQPVGLLFHIILLLLTLFIIQSLDLAKMQWIRITGPWLWVSILFCIQFSILFPHNLWLHYAALFFSSLTLKVLNTSYNRIRNSGDLNRLKGKMREFICFKEKVELTMALKDTFIDTIFHDIKNHVFSIETSINMLIARTNNDPGMIRKTRIIKLACRSIAYLLRNLMEIKQMEDGKIKMDKEFLNCKQIESIARKWMDDPVAEEKKIKVKIEPGDDSINICADSYLLERVLYNLFDNAFKYSYSCGEVRLACIRKADKALVSLFSSGKPLTAEQKVLIFGKYYRVQTTNTHSASQAYAKGLGLYFCKLVMQAHDGDIWVESSQEGNCFYLDFNAKQTPGAIKEPERKKPVITR